MNQQDQFAYQNAFGQYNLSSPQQVKDKLSYATTDYQSSKYWSSAKVNNLLPKPDFSFIEKKDRTLEFKEPGSYKKPKVMLPPTPVKSHKKSFNTVATPTNFGKQLFPMSMPSTKDENEKQMSSACRKLNFNATYSDDDDNYEEKWKEAPVMKGLFSLTPELLDCLEEKEEKTAKGKNCLFRDMNSIKSITFNPNIQNQRKDTEMTIDSSFTSFKNTTRNLFEKSGKFSQDYTIIKILSEKKHNRKSYKCLNKQKNKLYLVRKVKCASNQQFPPVVRTLFQRQQFPLSRYCIKYLDFWKENEFNNKNTFILTEDNSSLYSIEEYHHNGDLLDLQIKLEHENFTYTMDFYWDMIFEMLCGIEHLHQNGLIHFDIQPSNFFISSNGDIILGGLTHCRTYQDLMQLFLNGKKTSLSLSLEELFDGEAAYLAPELFNRSTLSDINYKCDVFSLGLSLLEIIGKINLPQNGSLWREIRTLGFILTEGFFSNWNTCLLPIANLIQRMINVDVNQRPSINDLLNDSVNCPEIYLRYKRLMNNSYTKVFMHLKEGDEEEKTIMEIDNQGILMLFPAKRSNSTMRFGFFD